MWTKWCAALAAVMVVCLMSSCGEARVSCSPDTCRGCCDAYGVCQPGDEVFACGRGGFACSTCSVGQVCHGVGWCVAASTPPPAVDAGPDGGDDAGAIDAGPDDAGVEDAGVEDAGVPDAGPSCGQGLVANAGFECGLAGWTVLEGSASVSIGGAEGQASLELVTDAQGQARVAAAEPIIVTAATTLCIAVKVRGTVPDVRLEVLTTPSNAGISFGAPVEADWTRVPPSMLRVPVPAQSQVYVMLRANGAASGQRLDVDDFEVKASATGPCTP
jgi:hypothetical protein